MALSPSSCFRGQDACFAQALQTVSWLDLMSLLAGMQSAALGFALARKHFADPLVAVPSAVSVVFMALGGSGLAVFWRGKPTTD